jgi:hypothetical protein
MSLSRMERSFVPLDGLNKMMAEVGIEAQINFEEETNGEKLAVLINFR